MVRKGPGLFEYLDESNTINYDPFAKTLDYSLSDEEKEIFSGIENDEERIVAEEVYGKLRGPKEVDSLKTITDAIGSSWNKINRESITIMTGEVGMELFDKAIKRLFK